MTEKKRSAPLDVQTAESIIERLPGFYKAMEGDSLFHKFVDAIASVIDEQQKDLLRVMNSHWVDFAQGTDLNFLASIAGIARKKDETDADYRTRIYNTLADPKTGGTVEAVKTQLAIHLATSKDNITLIENPPTEMAVEKQVISGDSWILSSISIKDEQVRVTIFLEDGEAREPTLIDTGRNQIIKYKGILRKGDRLEIYQGRAKLNGNDATASLSIEAATIPQQQLPPSVAVADFANKQYTQPSSDTKKDPPTISRKPSKWMYREKLSDTLGRFDQAVFDREVFFDHVPPTTVTFSWTACLLASFEVRVSASALERNNLTKKDLETLVNAIKAAGIRVFVTVMENNDKERSTGKPQLEDSKLSPMLAAGEVTNKSQEVRQ